MRVLVTILSVAFAFSLAHADSALGGDPFMKFADPNAVVAAIQTDFRAEPGKAVRISVYDSKKAFLDVAAVKHQGLLDETGLAIVTLRGLREGEYSFAAYLDEDGDGKLKRGALGRPKEPFAFSNGIVPKLRKPTFDETKVAVEPGSVVVITLSED